MRITKTFEYAASPQEAFAMMADPAFQAAKCEATHPLEHSESVTPKGDQTEIVTRRVVPTDDFPDFAKSMIGARIAVTETIIWSRASVDGSRTGTIALAIGDAPIRMTGTVRLGPSGTGTRVEVDGELKANVPLVGGRIEKVAAPSVIDSIDREHETGIAWLSR